MTIISQAPFFVSTHHFIRSLRVSASALESGGNGYTPLFFQVSVDHHRIIIHILGL